MDIQITPAALRGTVAAIPSKSAAHRALIGAALAKGDTVLSLEKRSEDIEATIECLKALGATIDDKGESLWISPISQPAENPVLNCRESGSTLRFLLPVAAALCKTVTFTGCGRLPQRPLSPLAEEMERHGAAFSARKLPFTVTQMTKGGVFSLPGNVSSQYITGLLLASPLLNGGAEITLTSPLQSAGYVEMTIAEMEKFKISINRTPHGFAVCQGRYCSPGALSAEGDWSNAAFWLAAGALAGPVSVTGLNSASAQGDREIAEILRKFGAAITQREDNCTASSGALSAAEINAAQIPDLVPVLAVVASVSKGVTRIKNAARLRLKESDRLFTTAQMLSRLGADIQEESDGLAIIGKPRLSGGAVSSFGDHRIAMAAAVAACACTSPVVITGAEATGKSYPSFWEDYQALGGVLHVI